MLKEVVALIVLYLVAAALIILVGNLIVRKMFGKIKALLEKHLAPMRDQAESNKVQALSLDQLLVRLECDLSDVVGPRCNEVAK